jgi:hypothetical protein
MFHVEHFVKMFHVEHIVIMKRARQSRHDR